MPPSPPTLNSIIVCDQAIFDAETRKRSLIGIFQNIRSTQFPCTHPMLTVYASVTDAQGEYVFTLRLVDLSNDRELWKASLPSMEIRSTSRTTPSSRRRTASCSSGLRRSTGGASCTRSWPRRPAR